MQSIKLTRASQLLSAAYVLENQGLAADRAFRAAGLPPLEAYSGEDLIPAQFFYAFLNQAARATGDRNIGLSAIGTTDLAKLGKFGALLASSLTAYDALKASCRYMHLHTSAARFWLQELGDDLWFCRGNFIRSNVPLEQSEQWIVANMIQIVRMGAGRSWTPAKLCLQSDWRPGSEAYDAIGDPEIILGSDVTAVAVPRKILSRRLPGSRKVRLGEVESLKDELSRTAPAADFIGAARQLVGTLMKSGAPQIQAIAEASGLSVRTLQRRLGEGGLTYSALLEQARYEKALRLLAAPELRVTDIAFDLGYSDSCHFTRAFRRWAGVTPREYRSGWLFGQPVTASIS